MNINHITTVEEHLKNIRAKADDANRKKWIEYSDEERQRAIERLSRAGTIGMQKRWGPRRHAPKCVTKDRSWARHLISKGVCVRCQSSKHG